MDVITGKTRPKSGKAVYDQSVDLTQLEPAAIARRDWPQVSETDGI